MTTLKVDYKKELKQFYNPKPIPEIVMVPPMHYLMIDGIGAIGGSEFQEAIETLFGVSYKAKFGAKKNLGFDYTVMPLEGLWWADNMTDFINGKKENWKWTLMIMQPDKITGQMIDEAIKEVLKKKELKALHSLRFETLNEGKSVQMMHIGPFSEEHPNIMKMHDLVKANNGKLSGKHHEIYLSDFRKVDPVKLKTILRQPFI